MCSGFNVRIVKVGNIKFVLYITVEEHQSNTRPKCYIQEVERGECKPLPQSAVLGAKDLAKTILSDHLEERLFRKLKQERQERARIHGKGFDEVIAFNMLSYNFFLVKIL